MSLKSHARVLVTGSTGFIGRYVLSLLDEDGVVTIATGRGERPNWLSQQISWIKGDLTKESDRSKVLTESQPTHIIHLAWFTEPGAFWNNEANLNWVIATLDLVQKFSFLGGKHVICAGSCAEYQWDSGIKHEIRTKIDPSSLFGVSKVACYRVLSKYAENVGITLGWGRIFFVYGPGEQEGRLVPSIISALKDGRVINVTSGRLIRDYLHVRDVARCFIQMLYCEYHGVINIGSGESIALHKIMKIIEESFGINGLIGYGALPDREGDPEVIVADTTKLTEDLRFAPKIGIEQGLKSTISTVLSAENLE
ncbi:NAD(P)-dependent oxidoreductase [Litoricolaceae bacterium]|nr:NAD(P)-dependent oxidoreductase [Litorivicinaceae bacterium]